MLMRPLSLASVFSAIGSLTAGMAAILKGAAATGTWSAGGLSQAAVGCAEALIPMFVAFSFLAVAWLLVTARHAPAGLSPRTAARLN